MKWLTGKRVLTLFLVMLLSIMTTSIPGKAYSPDVSSNVAAVESKNTLQDKTRQMIELIMKDLPSPRNEEGEAKNYKITMRDGAKLEAQVFLPEGKGPWPAILIRNPYANFKYFNEAILKSFSRFGYAGVLVDSRGTGESDGKWQPFVNEESDGLDVLDWLVKQEWMNGNIGLYGHSYLSFSEWIIADKLPPEVKTMYISAYGTNRYEQLYQDGMFKYDIITSWALSNSGIETKESSLDLYKKALLVKPPIEIDTQVLGTKLPWYRDWISNVNSNSDYWKQGMWADLKEIPKKVTIPVFMKVGWNDYHLDGMVEAYQNLPENIRKQSRFLIGPWNHGQSASGDIDYPDNNIAGIDGTKVVLEWYDHILQGKPYNKAKGVETYVVRDGVWKVFDNMPGKSDTNTRLYLDKIKFLGFKGGGLIKTASDKTSQQKYTYDPANPVPTVGGKDLSSGLIPNGNRLQSMPGDREDVLTYLSEPLEEDLIISGNINVKLYVSSNAKDTAFTAKVMEVLPNGNAYDIRDSITTLAYRNSSTHAQKYKPGSIVEIGMETSPITWTVKKGSRIRLDISSSNFPAYNVHSNTEGPWAEQSEYKIAKQSIYMGGIFKSYIELPTIKQ